MEESTGKLGRALALGHGGYYLATGLWPLVHLRSFEKVTGPKLEGWLVKTVGALVTVVGAALLLAGKRQRLGPEVRLLAVGSAVAFTLIDATYALKKRISPVYLLDAAPELALAVGWSLWSRRANREAQQEEAKEYEALLLGGRG